jgi:hypothetical protein
LFEQIQEKFTGVIDVMRGGRARPELIPGTVFGGGVLVSLRSNVGGRQFYRYSTKFSRIDPTLWPLRAARKRSRTICGGWAARRFWRPARHGGAHRVGNGGGGGKTRGEPLGGPVFFQPPGPPYIVFVRPLGPTCLQKRLAAQPPDYVLKERFRRQSYGEGSIGED